MRCIHTISELQNLLATHRQQGQRIALVPTMGNLHEGHLALVAEAKKCADIVVTSIFVNALQFGLNEDLERYPRTLAEDTAKLYQSGCDYLFAPSNNEMYPQGLAGQTQVQVPEISNILCGESRPKHFQGVATVVCKLFGICQPDIAIFGEKDFQQLLVIKRMVAELHIPVEIKGSAIIRHESGLAMSSRNNYLTAQEQSTAAQLYHCLEQAKAEIAQGNQDYAKIEQEAQQKLSAAGFKNDYFSVVDTEHLTAASPESKQRVILAAAYLGKARLIDNLLIDA